MGIGGRSEGECSDEYDYYRTILQHYREDNQYIMEELDTRIGLSTKRQFNAHDEKPDNTCKSVHSPATILSPTMATTLNTFRALPFIRQVHLVWEEVIHLATRPEADTVVLYHMQAGFFVELYYNHVSNQLQSELRTFTSTKELEPYTNYIMLPNL